MSGTDYVVRRWALTPAGHARVTVVDRHGRIAHVTVHDRYTRHGDIDGVIRQRLAALPALRVPPS